MNNSIQSIDCKENIVEIWGSLDDSKSEIALLIQAGINADQIHKDELCISVSAEHYPIVSSIFTEPDYLVKYVPKSFALMKDQDRFRRATEDIVALEDKYNFVLTPYKHAVKVQEHYKKKLDASNELRGFSFDTLKTKMFERIAKNYERGMLGMPIKTIPEINEKMLGLRGLMCLAAGPNCGKTSLSVQLMLETLVLNEKSCALFISLEMDAVAIFEHIYRLCADMTFRELWFKSDHDFTDNKIGAEKLLNKIASRIRILGKEELHLINSTSVVSLGMQLKQETDATHLFTVIDYLQIWPVEEKVQKYGDLERDKWLMAEMQKISHSFPDEPIIVISESRKPQKSNEEWAIGMSDISGSARFGYGFEAIFMINAISDRDILHIAQTHGIRLESQDKKELFVSEVRKELEYRGSVLCYLSLVKIRKGGIRFRSLLEFNYHKDRYIKATCGQSGDIFQLAREATFSNKKTS